MAERVLVVDDEPDLLELVRVSLAGTGFSVETAASGSEALEKLRRSTPDLLVLDLMLPDVSGTEICRRIRADARLASLPTVMLTARSEEIDRVVGFELGADDYVTKPFSPRELALRVQATLRRGGGEANTDKPLERGALRLDPESHRCWVQDVEVPLNYYPSDEPTRVPVNRWRAYAHLLFGNWINEVYQTTPFDVDLIGAGQAVEEH